MLQVKDISESLGKALDKQPKQPSPFCKRCGRVDGMTEYCVEDDNGKCIRYESVYIDPKLIKEVQ